MDCFAGCMLGLAVGDALGAPVEGLKAGHIEQLAGEVTGFVDPVDLFPDRPGKWRLKGLYTDDTQQALAVAEALAVYGGADAEALAGLYTRLANEGPKDLPFGGHRGTGHFFRRSVRAMMEASDPLACGQPSAGNGAAMRIAPAGLYYWDDEEALGRAVIEFSLMTHHDARGIAGALALARTVARFVRWHKESGDSDSGESSSNGPSPTGPFPPDAEVLQIAEELPGWVREWETRLDEEYIQYLELDPRQKNLHGFSKGLEALAALVREGDDALAEKTIVQYANACGPATRIAHPHSGFAPASVIMALYRAFSARDFYNGLVGAVNAGGDADTVGAMTGAVLGARLGDEAIPKEWTEGLVNAGQVRARADALRDREVDWANWEDYIEMEIALTENEAHAVRKALGDNRKAVEKRGQRMANHRERAAKTKEKRQAEAMVEDFAPPPEVWLRGGALGAEQDDVDPVQAKKDRAQRGRKRIAWKKERRQKQKNPHDTE